MWWWWWQSQPNESRHATVIIVKFLEGEEREKLLRGYESGGRVVIGSALAPHVIPQTYIFFRSHTIF